MQSSNTQQAPIVTQQAFVNSTQTKDTNPQKAEFMKKAKIGLIIWFILFLAIIVLFMIPLASIMMNILSYIPLITGLAYLAKAKGYSGWLGLMGIFYFVGLIFIVLLKDKTNENSKTKGNKLAYGFLIFFFLIIVLGAISSLLLAKIDPFKQLLKAETINCTNQCASSVDKNICINTCLNKYKTSNPGFKE